MKKFLGFTLSEVLITLGLLGVISAMTIPTLTYNYRSKLLESQFRTTYKEVKEISSYLDNEYGDVGEYANKLNALNWGKNFMAYVKGGQIYNAASTSTDVHIRQVINDFYKKAGASGGIHRFGMERNNQVGTICNNGEIWTDSKGRIWTFNAESKIVCVDVNGSAAPNMYNVDIFAFIPMKASQVAQWVYDDSASNSSEYSGQLVLCNADALATGHNSDALACTDKDGNYVVNKPKDDPTNAKVTCALDLCPFNFPIENTAPQYGDAVLKNRLGNKTKKSDDYWKDYIQYK